MMNIQAMKPMIHHFSLMLLIIGLVMGQTTQGLSQDCQSNPLDYLFLAAKVADNIGADFFPISEAEEMKIGEQMHKQTRQQFSVAQNGSQYARLKRIMNTLTPYLKRKGISYEIYLIDDAKMINAFAHAGGHIYVSTALMDFVESTDELAFVIGHELTHVDKRHTIRPIQKQVSAQQVLGEDYGAIAAQTQQILATPFGQIDEYEADWGGASLMKKAGYHPERSLDFFQKLKEFENPNLLEKFFRTHPFSDERICNLKQYINTELR